MIIYKNEPRPIEVGCRVKVLSEDDPIVANKVGTVTGYLMGHIVTFDDLYDEYTFQSNELASVPYLKGDRVIFTGGKHKGKLGTITHVSDILQHAIYPYVLPDGVEFPVMCLIAHQVRVLEDNEEEIIKDIEPELPNLFGD